VYNDVHLLVLLSGQSDILQSRVFSTLLMTCLTQSCWGISRRSSRL